MVERRLINPLNTPISRRFAYLLLLGADILAGAILFDPLPLGLRLIERSAAFCLIHLFLAVLLLQNSTPGRDTLYSWVWRLRGERSWLWDHWLGDRSANPLAIATMILIGFLTLIGCVLLPFGLREGFVQMTAELKTVREIALLTALVLATYGLMNQWFQFVGGRPGRGIFLTVLVLMIVPVHLIGHFYQISTLEAVTPSSYFGAWFSGGDPPNALFLVGVYGAILIATGVSLYRRLNRLERAVDRKLQQMGVPGHAA